MMKWTDAVVFEQFSVICVTAQQKNLPGVATRRVVSYTIQSTGFNVVNCVMLLLATRVSSLANYTR